MSVKRVKLAKEIPPIKDGVISASKSPEIETGRFVDVIAVNSNIDIFFDEDQKEIPEYAVSGSVMKALQNKLASEEMLRNAVYTDLMMNHGIQFPASSCKAESPSRARRFFQRGLFRKTIKEYIERDLVFLLKEFAQQRNDYNPSHESMHRIMRGLPITTTSRPDLAPLHATERGQIEMRLGEFKNAKNFKCLKARTQCINYLLCLLYWLRAEAGRKVEPVFGFYVCGCRCADMKAKSYVVGLVKLSTSQFLGDDMKAEYYQMKSNVMSPLPMQLLIHFLKNGKQWIVSKQDSDMPCNRRIPSLFVVPSSLWNDDNEPFLVHHGTFSMVFKISLLGLKQFLLDERSEHFKTMRNDLYWLNFCEDVSSLCQHHKANNDSKFYIKIRSKDLSFQHKPMGAMWDAWDQFLAVENRGNNLSQIACDSILRTYPFWPYTRDNIGVAVMHDRGYPIMSVLIFDKASIALTGFQAVMKTAIFLSTCLPHGDVLPHNIVVDDNSNDMALIDLDEGVIATTASGKVELPKQKNAYNNDNNDWYLALNYPNVFCGDAVGYTKVELIASFVYLMTEKVNMAKVSGRLISSFKDICERAEDLGRKIYDVDKDDTMLDIDIENEYLDVIGALYKDMEHLVDEIIVKDC
jgi:hypothetical protein